MKESIVTFLFVFGLQSGTALIQSPRLLRGIAFLGGFFCLIQLRLVVAMVLAISLMAFLAIRYIRRPRWSVILAGGGLLLMLVLADVSNVPIIRDHGSPLSLKFYQSQAKIANERPAELNASNPALSLGVLTSGALTEGKFYWIPVRFLLYYFNPPPWTTGYGTWDPFRMSSALIVWMAMPAMAYGLVRLARQWRTTYFLLIPFLSGSILISSATPFLDDRLRTMMMPLFLAVAFWGWEEIRKWWQFYLLMPVVAVPGIVVYEVYKSGWFS